MKCLNKKVLGGLCLLLLVAPLFGAVEPSVMVTSVAGNVKAISGEITWEPLLGETLSEGTRIVLDSDKDCLDLVHLKLQKEVHLVGPKTITIGKQGLENVSEQEYGQSVGGIPSDLAMSADGLNQVGAVRDHAPVAAPIRSSAKGIQVPQPEIEKNVEKPQELAVETGGTTVEDSAKETERMKQSEWRGDSPALHHDEYAPQAAAPSPADSKPQGSSVGESSSEESTSGHGAQSASKPMADRVPVSGSNAMSAEPAAAPPLPPPAPSPQVTVSDIAFALPGKTLAKAHVINRKVIHVTVLGEAKQAKIASSSMKDWVILTVSGVQGSTLMEVSLLSKDGKTVRSVIVDPMVEKTVLGALNLESRKQFEMAAYVWLELLKQGKVIEKVAMAHLARIQAKIDQTGK